MKPIGKRIASLLLAVVLLCTVFPAALSVQAADPSALTFTVTDGKATLTHCKPSAKGKLTVPSTYKGYPVTAIAFRAFGECDKLTSVRLPNTIKTIDNYAFSQCNKLESVTLPKKLPCLNDGVFYQCENLVSIRIPNTVKKIGRSAFNGCRRLKSITLPKKLEGLNTASFRDCESLVSIRIPDRITSIDGSTFSGCTALKTVRLPKKLKSISSCAFSDCRSLKSIAIPKTVERIGSLCFSGCGGLEKITVAKGNRKYASEGNCLLYKKSKRLIRGCNNSVIPKGVKLIMSYAFNDCTKLKRITIPKGVKTIENNAFADCKKLEKVTLPNTVTSIGGAVFEGCTKLRSVNLPSKLTSIAGSTFSGCTSLTSVTIPNTVTSIGYNAFEGTSLTSITFPKKLVAVNDCAFISCPALESIRVESGNPTYTVKNNCLIRTEDKTLVLGCKNSIIPDDGSVTAIGWSAFEGCASLTSVTIPKQVTSIGYRAFAYCPDLKSIRVNESNKIYTAVDNCLIEKSTGKLVAGCKNSSIPDDGSVTAIGYYAFTGCSSPTVLTIPEGVTAIEYQAFANCTTLKRLYLPLSLQQIQEDAFANCSGLTRVYYVGTEDQWNAVGITVGYGEDTKETDWMKKVLCRKVDVYKMQVGIDVSWDKMPAAKTYHVYRRTAKGKWKKIKTTTALYYTDKTAKKGVRYTYSVKAVTSRRTVEYIHSDPIKR